MNIFSITPTAYCISQGLNAICIISAPAHQKKEVVGARWLTAPKNALFPIEENQICTLLVHFSLLDKAASSDGKWVDESRPKPVTWSFCWRGGRQLINKWHHLPRGRLLLLSAVTLVALDMKKRGRKGEKEIFPIRAVWTDAGVRDTGDSLSVCGDGNFKMFWPLCPNYWQQTHRIEREEDRLQ